MKKNIYLIFGLFVTALIVIFIFLKSSGDTTADKNGAYQMDAGRLDLPTTDADDKSGRHLRRERPAASETAAETDTESYGGLGVDGPGSAVAFDQASADLVNDPYDPAQVFPDSERLKEPSLTEEDSIASLRRLLEQFPSNAKATHVPASSNVEVTNALLGKNPGRVAFMPQSHPRINSFGSLVDSWGNPYLFTTDSSMNVIIRSAGEDKVLNTEDDVVSE